jgi:hypothetical protein
MHRIAALLLATFGLAAALIALPAAAMQQADFGAETPSADARHVADWAVDSGDTAAKPFIVVDKVQSRVFVFDRAGRLLGAARALVGSATGDHSVPGIGQRKMSSIRPEERTTPAGRFVASVDRSLAGDEILWVDYDAAIALHRVIATVPKERRLQRLESRTAGEHRITYGCINVPVRFFDDVVAPTFRGGGGVVYVLPEMRPAREIFGSYDSPPPAPKALP